MKLLLAFIAIPLIEIVLFIKIGEIIGVAATLILILLSAVIGINLLRKQSFSIIQKMREHREGQKQLPEDVFAEFCKFMGAIFLIVPGFFTDLIGILLYIPGFQRFLFNNNVNRQYRTSKKSGKHKQDKTVIDVEYIEIVEEKDAPSKNKKADKKEDQ